MHKDHCRSAISWLACCALLLGVGSAQAAPVGQVTNLSGPLFAVNAEGTRRVLSVGSSVDTGDTLVTEGNTYAQVRFLDQGVVTLRPGTHFKIEAFAYEAQAPEKDNAVFGLLKGAMRKMTGLIGKRGNQDAYRVVTPTATIGIRGTGYGAVLCPGPACAPQMPPGTYVDVFSGAVALGPPPPPPGAPPVVFPPITLTAGQFGFAPPGMPPQQLPGDPGLGQGFTPPPSFQRTEQQGQRAPAGEPFVPPPADREQAGRPGGCQVR